MKFRKAIFKNKAIQEVLIYSSSPKQRIVGRFRIGKSLKNTPERLWELCRDDAGIDQESFFKYFSNKSVGFAIEIQDLHQFTSEIDPHYLIPEFHAPQSYCYTNLNLH